MNPSISTDQGTFKQLGLYVLIGIVLTFMFYFSVSSEYRQVSKEEGGTRFTDFAYYMTNVEWFWFSDSPEIYRVETQSRIFHDLVDAKTDRLMLPHLTPMALIAWMPLGWLSRIDRAAAHALWMGISFTGYFASAHDVYAAMRTWHTSRRIVLILLYFLTTLSFSTLINVTTGQTTVLACGLLALIGLSTMNSGENDSLQWFTVLGLTILAIKPHYYLFGAALAFAARKRREVLLSAGIILVACLLLSFRLGFKWPLEYLHVLSVHSQPAPSDGIGFSVMPDRMANFRGAFYLVFGIRIASSLTVLLFGSITVIALSASLVRGCLDDQRVKNIPDPAMINVLLLGGYLLFSPHIYPYEDVLIAAMITLAILYHPEPFGFNFGTAGVLAAAILQVNPSWFPTQTTRRFHWIVKFILWVYLLYVSRPVTPTTPDTQLMPPETELGADTRI